MKSTKYNSGRIHSHRAVNASFACFQSGLLLFKVMNCRTCSTQTCYCICLIKCVLSKTDANINITNILRWQINYLKKSVLKKSAVSINQ